MRLKTIARGASALLALASLTTGSAQATADTQVRLGVVTYAGEKVAGGLGCKYTGSETVSYDAIPDGMVIDERQIGHDLATCTLTMQRRFVPASEVVHAAEKTAGETVEAATGGNASAQISRLVGAFHKTYYEDPPGIDVTSVEVEVAWMADDVCVSYYDSDHNATLSKFEYTGWVQNSGWWGTYADCSGASTSASAMFSNSTFCPALGLGPTTYNEYDVMFIKGLVNDQYYIEWATYLWGGCANLLTFGHVHGKQNYNDV